MKTIFLGLAALILAPLVLAPLATAGEPVDLSLDADPAGTVSVKITRGKVTVLGWDQSKVSVQGTRDDNSEEFIFKRSGNTIRIKDRVDNNFFEPGEGGDLTIRVPRGNNLEVAAVSADLMADGIAGGAGLNTVSGDIEANNLGDSVRIKSVSGEIQLHGAGRSVSVESVSGDIDLAVNAEKLQAQSISGDVNVRNQGALERGHFSTVSGDSELASSVAANGDLEISSVSGSVTFTAIGELNARIYAKTGPGGDIENSLTDDSSQSTKYTGAESLKIRMGDGSADVNLSVISGTIYLRKQ